jgi:transglutaminase-like putative cysteine protease
MYMNRFFTVVCGVLLWVSSVAKDSPKFPVSAIPEALKKDVHVVMREDQMVFTILSKSRATHHVYQAITILNANGKRFAQETVGYDKLSKVTSFKAAVYDAEGMLIKRLKSSEIYDQSAYDGYSLYSDNRIKAIDLSQSTYPYTVEIEYDVEYKYLFSIPDFYVLTRENCSVQHSVCKYVFPKALAPRHRTYNIDVKAVAEPSTDGLETLSWTFENVMPIKLDPMGPDLQYVLPHIDGAPTQFEYDGYVGTMDSWDQFGQWISSLNQGRNVLPEVTKQKIRALTAQAKTDEEKIKILYEYMQSKTRYVSIQLGIGGFQPFEASVVDQTGYGDCKALSNYMVSMLKEIGIPAHYVLIRAGSDASPMDTDFPSSQFNHAIVAVPNKGDTLWLECTSQTNPFGYMGRFTGDRKALVITDKGAKVVNTKRYPADKNIQSRIADVYVEATGDAKAKVKTSYQGLQYENNYLNAVVHLQYDDQRKWVQNNTEIPSFDVNSFSLVNHKDKMPSAEIVLDLRLGRFASVNGKRTFLTPNLMNRSTFVAEKVEGRKTPVVLESGFMDLDTIRYHLPEGVYPEFLPDRVKITSRFGEYESSCVLDEHGLLYVRRLKQVKGQFPAESYKEFADFYKSVNRADHVKIVLLSKT